MPCSVQTLSDFPADFTSCERRKRAAAREASRGVLSSTTTTAAERCANTCMPSCRRQKRRGVLQRRRRRIIDVRAADLQDEMANTLRSIAPTKTAAIGEHRRERSEQLNMRRSFLYERRQRRNSFRPREQLETSYRRMCGSPVNLRERQRAYGPPALAAGRFLVSFARQATEPWKPSPRSGGAPQPPPMGVTRDSYGSQGVKPRVCPFAMCGPC